MLYLSIITFRESLEVLIILITIFTYIYKINIKTLIKYIIFGSICGIFVSTAFGQMIFKVASSLSQYLQNVFIATLNLFLSIIILYFLVWLRKQNNLVTLKLKAKYNYTSTSFGLLIFSFLAVLKESLEVVYSALPMITFSFFLIIIVCLVGLFSALLVIFIIFNFLIKVNLKILFNITTIFLIYIGSALFGGALSLILPSSEASIETAGFLIFCIPTGYSYIKNSITEFLYKNSL